MSLERGAAHTHIQCGSHAHSPVTVPARTAPEAYLVQNPRE